MDVSNKRNINRMDGLEKGGRIICINGEDGKDILIWFINNNNEGSRNDWKEKENEEIDKRGGYGKGWRKGWDWKSGNIWGKKGMMKREIWRK